MHAVSSEGKRLPPHVECYRAAYKAACVSEEAKTKAKTKVVEQRAHTNCDEETERAEKAENAKAEAEKAENAKAEAVKAEADKAETEKAENAKAEAVKAEAAKLETEKAEDAQAEIRKVEIFRRPKKIEPETDEIEQVENDKARKIKAMVCTFVSTVVRGVVDGRATEFADACRVRKVIDGSATLLRVGTAFRIRMELGALVVARRTAAGMGVGFCSWLDNDDDDGSKKQRDTAAAARRARTNAKIEKERAEYAFECRQVPADSRERTKLLDRVSSAQATVRRIHYLQRHNIPSLVEGLLAASVASESDNPLQVMLHCIERKRSM